MWGRVLPDLQYIINIFYKSKTIHSLPLADSIESNFRFACADSTYLHISHDIPEYTTNQ